MNPFNEEMYDSSYTPTIPGDFANDTFQNFYLGDTLEASQRKSECSPTNLGLRKPARVSKSRNENTGLASKDTAEDPFMVLELSPSREELRGCSVVTDFTQAVTISKINQPTQAAVSNGNRTIQPTAVEDSSNSCKPKLGIRRDVVNKRIVRYFRKYLCSLSIEDKMICRLKKSISEVKADMISKATKLGILEEGDSEAKKEFLCWMFMNKKTSKVRNIFQSGNASIEICTDLFLKYSHTKLNTAMKDPNVASLFLYFYKNAAEEFLSQFSGDKREAHESGLKRIIRNSNIILEE